MIDLSRFFENQFDARIISDDRLRSFTADHIQRMIANNTDGRYDPLIEPTKTFYDAYFNAIQTEDVRLTEKQAMTLTKDVNKTNFVKAIRQKEGIIRGTWGKQSPEYREFFPRGVAEYTRCTLANAENLMARIVNLSDKYKDVLGQAFVDLFTQLQNAFVTAREQQLQKSGKVSDLKQTTRGNREALTNQLTKNLLSLAIDSIGEPQRVTDFFDQRILRRNSRRSASPENETVSVNDTVIEDVIAG